jgi:hypothetical protein
VTMPPLALLRPWSLVLCIEGGVRAEREHATECNC